MTGTGVPFLKGHGTRNDFVLLPDVDDRLDLEAATVAAICDRRGGVGADGVLRVVRDAGDGGTRWFMDYRNADGSLAEMCGNGLRVFARYLVDAGLEPPGDVPVRTRAGLRVASVPAEGDVTVDLGVHRLAPAGPIEVAIDGRRWPATGVDMGNPHAVAFVEDLAHAGDLREPPVVTPPEAFPQGVNVELVVERGPAHVAMRVHERGSGETQSCGTGAGAVAVAAALRAGGPVEGTWRVDVPGGTLHVEIDVSGQVRLRGPAEIVAEGVLRGRLAPARR